MDTKFAINIEVNLLEQAAICDQPVEDGETVIGTLSPQLQNLYTLWKSKLREANRLMLDIDFTRDKEPLYRAQSLAKTLEAILMHEVRVETNHWEGQLGFRQHWQVVAYPVRPWAYPPFGEED
jgi:hypothetical protein